MFPPRNGALKDVPQEIKEAVNLFCELKKKKKKTKESVSLTLIQTLFPSGLVAQSLEKQ